MRQKSESGRRQVGKRSVVLEPKWLEPKWLPLSLSCLHAARSRSLSVFVSPGLWCRGITPLHSLSVSLSLSFAPSLARALACWGRGVGPRPTHPCARASLSVCLSVRMSLSVCLCTDLPISSFPGHEGCLKPLGREGPPDVYGGFGGV